MRQLSQCTKTHIKIVFYFKMTQTYSNENIVNLDLWGGTHEYDKLDYTYYLNRHAGLFSNLCVCSYGLLTYYNMGFKPKNISLILTEYDDTFNFYDKLFKTSNTEINFDDISTEKFNHCLRYQEPSHLGLGREKDHINFDICKRIINKYFLLSDDTKTIIKGIIKKIKLIIIIRFLFGLVRQIKLLRMMSQLLIDMLIY